uniref:hypothetical protein n=1 Tax=Sphaeromyxa zaharoni TaxID=275449 RepID=UPI0030037734
MRSCFLLFNCFEEMISIYFVFVIVCSVLLLIFLFLFSFLGAFSDKDEYTMSFDCGFSNDNYEFKRLDVSLEKLVLILLILEMDLVLLFFVGVFPNWVSLIIFAIGGVDMFYLLSKV